ncbi:MAG: glutathione S-transferase [Roseovarius sp.]|nr:glutathione S-transferase [Roseovarius sp.]
MTYDLFIGDRTFSSWSLRGWLMFEKFGIPAKTHMAGLYSGTLAEDLSELHPARQVPAMRDADGIVVYDTLAMAETLAERHPEKGLWPLCPSARALARSITAEMHSGFSSLRSDCPMQLAHQIRDFKPSGRVLEDLERIDLLWTHARQKHGVDGPWLFSSYSIADAFYAPVAARIAGYGLEVGKAAREYVSATLGDTAFRQWRAMGLTVKYDPAPHDAGLPVGEWPGPAHPAARAVGSGRPENAACPYSGGKAEYMLETEGRIFGFCNPFCRDKTAADPDAWPKFIALRDGAHRAPWQPRAR